MTKSNAKQPDALKLSRADARKLKKVATGPLLGPVPGHAPEGPTEAATVSLIGSIQDVRAAIARLDAGT